MAWFARCIRCKAEYADGPWSALKSRGSFIVNPDWCDRCGPTLMRLAFDENETISRPGLEHPLRGACAIVAVALVVLGGVAWAVFRA